MTPSITTIANQVKAYKPPGTAQGNFKALLEGYLETGIENEGDKREMVLCLREDLPPSVLYSTEMLSGPHQLYRNLRDYLACLGLEYRQHRDSNRIIYGLPAMLYNDESEIDSAITILRQWQETEKGIGSQMSSDSNEVNRHSLQTQPSFSVTDESKLAHNVALRYKTDDKFSASIDEDILEYIAGFEEVATDYGMNETQKKTLFHNVFRDEPKRFYRSIMSSCQSYKNLKDRMIDEYSGLIRQNRVRKHLQGLRLHNIMNQKQCNVGNALASLRESISKMAPQGLPAHRTEDAKVEYLYKAVVGASWARSALSQVYSASSTWSFQQLYTALDAAWLQEQEENEGRQRDNIETTNNETAAMLYAGQGVYGLPRRKGSRSSLPYRSETGYRNRNDRPNCKYGRNGADHYGNPRRCNNCQSKDHLIRRCNKNRNLLQSVSQMVDKNPHSTREILFEVCRQTEDALFSDTESCSSSSSKNDGAPEVTAEQSKDTPAASETFYELLSRITPDNNLQNFNDPEDF